MPEIKELILEKSAELKEEVIQLRRHFHRHPELSYEETETSKFISAWLGKNRISFRKGIAGTGIIGTIKGKSPEGKVIALRAEMDALPITERNKTEYSSLNTGKMHACGHDAHLAMLMGTAKLLNSISDRFAGTILLIFQPGEEKSPGGARLIIESGALNNPKPDLVISQHVLPELETGKVGYKSGRYMASCDEIYLTVIGKGGHAALPGLTTDQIYIASRLVIRLKERMLEQQKVKNIPTVLGIGRISGEGATNIIPEKVFISGTFRTFDEQWRSEALNLIRSVSEETAQEYGVKIDVNIAEGYPVLHNDETMTAMSMGFSESLLGKEKIETFETRMSSDDFSFYSALAPSLYYRVGIRKKDTEMLKLHTSDFDIDEDGMQTG
ncbi:MAG TPA: M20 family metallopeptidase, partial [Bacteroidales bacterium]|nr:M20 family metallopeptidase [Bacteroidales bacterium]